MVYKRLGEMLIANEYISKESACSAGHLGSILGLGRSPGEGNGFPPSIVEWRILQIEEPGGILSTGSQKSWT